MALAISKSLHLQVGREDQAVGAGLEAAGQADADAFDLFSAAGAQEALDAFDDAVDGGLGIGGGGHHFLRRELAVGVGQGDGGLHWADVDADDDALVIEAQKGRAAAAREASGGAFEHPVLFDQLFDDEGNGAALQAGDAGEVGAGDGVPGADEVEDDAAVDVANDFGGGDLDSVFVGGGHEELIGRR